MEDGGQGRLMSLAKRLSQAEKEEEPIGEVDYCQIQQAASAPWTLRTGGFDECREHCGS